MADKKKILILGAGYAGVEAAKVFSKKFKNNDNVEITLIDQNAQHTLMTELHEIAGHRTEKESVMVDVYSIFKAQKTKFVRDKITAIDYAAQKVTSETSEYAYDYLILGFGAEPTFFGVPGVQENSFTLWSLQDALKVRAHVENCFLLARDERDPDKRRKLLTIIVAGAGFTGVEAVGELMEWKKVLCEKYDIDEKDVNLYNVEAMPNILPVLRDSLKDKAKNFMIKKGVKVLTGSGIIRAEKEAIELKDGTIIENNTLIWTCGVQGNSFCMATGITEGKRNRIQVNDYLQSPDHENVYAIGDNAYYEIDGKPIPQIVETAIQTGACAANNIIAEINKQDKKKFELNTHGFMVSIGSHYCVAELMGTPMSGFLAMLMKHMVNLHYLWGVGGVKLIWNYILHEFFHMKDNRSFVGGHFSHNTKTFWLFPLRIFVGIMWLLEGIKKVNEGWLNPANIFIVQVQGTSGASEAVTEGAATAVTPILAQPPAIYQWFTDTIIAPNAFLFQSTVVLMEIGIGLALIAGLFTFFASIGSLFMVANFILSAMAGVEILWYAFAAIALMGGAGGALGLDYYVQPWIKRWWKNTNFAQRTYLYFD